MVSKIKICIVGAGMSGICAAKNANEIGFNVTIFEQAEDIGGQWMSSTKNKLQHNVYKKLRMNLPKEILGYPDFPFTEMNELDFPSEDGLKFYRSYGDKFNIRKLMKFQNYVVRVRPLQEKNYEVIVKDLVTNKYNTYYFDNVIICSGHHLLPNIPDFDGLETFQGIQLHSFNYECPEQFKNKSVLIVGHDENAVQIANQLITLAKDITISNNNIIRTTLPNGVIEKPELRKLYRNKAEFSDDSTAEFDGIIYCTGYRYSFPFLSSDCNVRVNNDNVEPLWKQIINIDHPTMAFIGIPDHRQYGYLVDAQVKFVLSYFGGKDQFPKKIEMIDDTNKWMKMLQEKEIPRSKIHSLNGELEKIYFDDLRNTAQLENIFKLDINAK